MGCQSGTKVSRYERSARQPNLKTAFIFEAIFRAPTSELFSGMFQKIEKEVLVRAELLVQKLMQQKPSSARARKLEALSLITGKPIKATENL